MKAQHKPPEPSYYTLPELAKRWGCDVDQVRLYIVADGLPAVELSSPDGGMLLAINREDVEQFEDRGEQRPARYNPRERESHLALIGAFAVAWSGADVSMMEEPGRLTSDLEQTAAMKGVPMLRGYDTNTNAIREALELLEANGYQRPRPHRPCSEVIEVPTTRGTLDDKPTASPYATRMGAQP